METKMVFRLTLATNYRSLCIVGAVVVHLESVLRLFSESSISEIRFNFLQNFLSDTLLPAGRFFRILWIDQKVGNRQVLQMAEHESADGIIW